MLVKCTGFATLGALLHASPGCADVVVVVIPAVVPADSVATLTVPIETTTCLDVFRSLTSSGPVHMSTDCGALPIYRGALFVNALGDVNRSR